MDRPDQDWAPSLAGPTPPARRRQMSDREVRAEALRRAVAAVQPTTWSAAGSWLTESLIERAKSFEHYIKTGAP